MRRYRDTQIMAYEDVIKTLADRQRAVMHIIEEHSGGLTAEETADILGVPLNTISGRFTELNDLGVLRAVGNRMNRSGKKAKVWDIKPPEAPVVHRTVEDNGQYCFA
jgi:predicted transcriptional regulator